MILDKFDFQSLIDYFTVLVNYGWAKETTDSEITVIISDDEDLFVVSSMHGSKRTRLLAGVVMDDLKRENPELHRALDEVFTNHSKSSSVT